MHDHFLSEGHNGLINDVKIVFIDKTDSSDLTRREEFWRNKLKTLAPYSLNVEEQLAGVCCFWQFLRYFGETGIYNVSKCQCFKVLFCGVIEGLISCI